MSSFDPAAPSLVHDELNGIYLRWLPDEWAANYIADRWHDRDRGVMEWDGHLLDGWLPADADVPVAR